MMQNAGGRKQQKLRDPAYCDADHPAPPFLSDHLRRRAYQEIYGTFTGTGRAL